MSQAAPTEATELYLAGAYKSRHPDWHLADAPRKAADLQPGLDALLKEWNKQTLRLADVGAGTGGVLDQVLTRLRNAAPQLDIQGTGFEIAAEAVALGRQQFPHLDLREKSFTVDDGPFDAVMLVDVLEHLENPWALLREARAASSYLLVRQPLLENFSTFRHRNYRAERETWGHIGFFTYRSFLDLAAATGWQPVHIELRAPWELADAAPRRAWLQRLLVRLHREWASFFLAGFYLNGLFRAV
ncbi:MAG TPA: methyltransferase domain-containing protein [Gemmatales bacterium]|nr:methyltransferase domain-containing protein [Gemmatales bacterium]HMP60388.1 methyltransferase domain-containing protein [Gemmatales bacterium]